MIIVTILGPSGSGKSHWSNLIIRGAKANGKTYDRFRLLDTHPERHEFMAAEYRRTIRTIKKEAAFDIYIIEITIPSHKAFSIQIFPDIPGPENILALLLSGA